MKKSLKSVLSALLLTMLFLIPVHSFAAAGLHPISGTLLNDQVLFEMDGQAVIPVGDDGTAVLPISYNGTTYLPVRAMGYLLGLGIDYESSTQTVLITSTTDKVPPTPALIGKSGQLIPIQGALLNGDLSFKINNNVVVPIGQDGSPVLPISYNGTTYLPVRALGNLLGIGVDYHSQTNTVLLYKDGKVYTDDQGNEVAIIYGAKAFADKVVEYVPGDPAPTEPFQVASKALGEPDFVGSGLSTWDGSVSLGGGGQITLEFTEVYLVDGPGDDLHVFEVGPSVESMELEISKDNKNWIHIGKVSGGTAAVDIGPFVQEGDRFSFVRLTDLRDNPSGATAGADLDAVAAVNNVLVSDLATTPPVETVPEVPEKIEVPLVPQLPEVPQVPEVPEKPEIEATTYTDGQGSEVLIELGASAFAGNVVEYVPGNPSPTEPFQDASRALGEPDYVSSSPDDGFVSLGGSGQITLEFTEVYLVDGPGADLHVFEIGPAVESMELEISKDNETWIHIGKISGGTAAIDISPFIQEGDQFSFVRLTDLRDNPSGRTAGADIDAVAAVNGIVKDK